MIFFKILVISVIEVTVLSNQIYDFGHLTWKLINLNQSKNFCTIFSFFRHNNGSKYEFYL